MSQIKSKKRVVTKKQIFDWITYSGTFLVLGFVLGSPGPILTDLQYQVNTSLNVISYMFAFRGIGYMFGAKLGGIIVDLFMKKLDKNGNSDKHGIFNPHHIYFIMLLVSNIMNVFVTFTSNIYVLAILVGISGVTLGSMDTLGNVLLLASFDSNDENDELVAPYMQFLHFAFGFGAFMAPLLIQLSFYMAGNYYYAYYIIAVMSIPFLVMLVCRKTPVRESELSTTESTQELKLISDPERIDTNVGVCEGSIETKEQNENSKNSTSDVENNIITKENDTHPVSSKNRILVLSMFVLFFIVYAGSETGYGSFITLYTTEYGLSSDFVGRIMTSVYWGSFSLGRLISVYIAKILSCVNMLILDYIGCFIASTLLLIGNGNLNMIYISSSIFGLFLANIFPTTIMLAETTIKVTGNNASLMIVGASIGDFILPTLMGNIISIFGIQYFHILNLIFTLTSISILIIILVLRIKLKNNEKRGSTQK